MVAEVALRDLKESFSDASLRLLITEYDGDERDETQKNLKKKIINFIEISTSRGDGHVF